MAYIGNQNYQAYVTLASQTFTTSGSTTIYALNYTVTNANNLDLYVGGSKQQPSVAYTAAGNTLTLTTATSSSMYAVYLGQGIQTVTPGATSVGTTQMNYPLGNFRSTGITDNASTTAVTIDTSQNVGIGTTSPAAKLHVKPTTNVNIFGTFGGSAFQWTAINDAQSAYVDLITNALTQQFQTGGTERMRIDSSGALILAGSTAQKASGTAWSNPSDTRLKDNKQNYTKGLNELLQINVKTWEWNGKAGTTQGDVGIGVIADEIETILPNTIDTYKAKLNEDDTEQTDVKRFDATEITWLLLNSIKELSAKNDALEATSTSQQTKIEELSSQVTQQQSTITQLQADVAALKTKVGI